MKTVIPKYVQDVYRYFGIPESEWPQHYQVDSGIRRGIRPEAASTYRALHRDLRNQGAV